MKKKNKKKITKTKERKGFTLIEILAAITILGILSTIAIVSVNKIIQDGKKKHYDTAEKNLMLAGQSYAQDNRNALPKVVGQKTKVYLSTLQQKKYINEVLDYNENECENSKSYVQIYKYSQTDYSYFSYIECPSYKTSVEEKISTPTITITMSGVKKDAEAKIEITDENKLISYSYIVYKGTKEVLNSGSVMVKNYAKKVDTTVNLNKYTPGTIKVIVTATNIYGNSTTKTVTNNFEDTSPPTCIISEEDQNPKTWISTGTRKITVGCDDKEGSGCTRETFTKVFKDSALTDYITISDESGNTTRCEVTVYIDKEKPSITVNAYKRTSSGGKTGSILATKTVKHTSPTATLDLSSLNSTKWLNKSNYPNGIYYEVKYSDDVYLASYNVKENAAGLSTSTIEAATTTIQSKTTDKKSVTDSYSTTEDGYRTYIITATDIAGNSIDISVKTPLDRVAPTLPTINMYKWKNNSTRPTSSTGLSTYTNDTWSSLNIYTTASSSTDAISGFKEYQVTASGATTDVTNQTQSYRSVEAEGTSYVSYRACDNAGNCSSHTTNKTIKIDKTGPSCTVTGGSATWTNGSRTVTATCTDLGSGCATTPFSKTYSTQISTTTAGAVDNNNGGVVYDNVGNMTNCPANQTVRIDKTAPSCSVSGGSTTWTNGSRTITATCTDTGGSGCEKASISKKYETQINTTTAGAAGNNSGGTLKDNAGNITTCAANQTVKIDKTAPSCSVSGGSTTWTNGSRTITATCTDSGGSGCEKASISKKYETEINTTTAGAVGNNSGGTIKDNAGNTTTCEANQTVKIDKTGPGCTVTGGSTTWTNGSRKVTATCTDSGSGCATSPFSKTYNTQISTTTAGAVDNNNGGVVYDNAGNMTNCSANQTVKIDKTAPSCSVSGGSTTWTNGSRTITATCSDAGGSGCSKASFSKTYSSTINTTTAGAVGVNSGGSVTDNAGNTANCPANQTVKVDKNAPTCSTSGGSSTWTNGNRYLVGTCTDTGGSGCAGDSSNNYTTNTNTTSANPGKVYDVAGNSATCPNTTVRIDKTAPSCSVTGGSSSWTNGNRVITATCSDTGGSGCATSPFSKTYSSNINTTTAGAKGNNSGGTVYDNAGNSKNCSANQTVKIDKTDPTISSIYNPSGGNATAPGLVLTLYGSDSGGSGMSHWRYSYNGYSWTNYSSSGYSGYQTTPFTAIRNQNVYIGLCDNAGNCASSSTYVNIVDPCSSTTTTWNAWGSCSKTCGGGTRTRTGTKYSNKISGYSCGPDSQSESCNTQSCEDAIYATRYNDCDSYYITTCNTTTCSYSQKNGVSASGTIARNSLTTSRGNCSKTYCSAYINSRSGTTVTFTISPQVSQCKVTGYSVGSCTKQGSANYSVKVGFAGKSDGSGCSINVDISGIAYIWNGGEYDYISWSTYKCSSSKYCTQDCNRSSPCV